MPEQFSAKSYSADVDTSADSLRENHDHLNSIEIEQLSLQESQERKQLEQDLVHEMKDTESVLDEELEGVELYVSESNLDAIVQQNYPNNNRALEVAKSYLKMQSAFGVQVTSNKLNEVLSTKLTENSELSKTEEITLFKEQLSTEGKSSEFILKSLIAEFKNDPDVSTWVENWQKFLRLHELSKIKSPQERKIIQNIISNADFTNENAFAVSLNSIRSNSDLSESTKLEIFTEFDGSGITSINGMDSGLKFLKDRKQKASLLLEEKQQELGGLNSEIEELKSQLDKLPKGSNKQEELEKQLAEKIDLLKVTQDQVELLETESEKDLSFEIRNGFSVELDEDGSRSIKNPENFSLKLPSNSLPFMGTKNLRTVNLSFVCSPLKKLGIMNEVFTPNLYSGDVPSKVHRDTGHLILDSLGISDKEILSEKDIITLNRDLSRIMGSGILSPREHLVQLGLYDVADQSFDMKLFKRALQFAKENRELNKKTFLEQLKIAL